MTPRKKSSITRKKSAYHAPESFEIFNIDGIVSEMGPAPRLSIPDNVFVVGDSKLLSSSMRVAIVGSRDASTRGLDNSARIARWVVGNGGVVVSGLAKGIDRAAHVSAIDSGGRTIAVIGTPVDKAYPAEHAELQETIYREHLLISQFKIGERTYPSSFPQRNRLMALLSHATIIVEASDTSGALSQAAECQRLGRKLLILRSLVEDRGLAWPASFVRSGAIVVNNGADLRRALLEAGVPESRGEEGQGLFFE